MTQRAERPTIAGVVLAGGQSQRMGRDKAGIDYLGQTFLDRAQALLKTVGCAPVLVSGRPELPGGIPDQTPEQGPALSMLDSMSAITGQCDGVLFVPVDMPLLESADLLPLLSSPHGLSRAWTKYPLPVFLSIRQDLPPRTDVRSVKYLLSCLEMDWLDLPPDRGVNFSNVNSPEELTKLSH